MINRVDFQPIQFKEPSCDRHIADKVKRLHGPHCTEAILFLWKVTWFWPGMAIMCLGQFRGIANRISFALRAEAFGEILHSTQRGPQIHIAAVQKHAQQGVSGTRVGNQL